MNSERPTIAERIWVCIRLCLWFVFVYNSLNWITSQRNDIGTAVFGWELRLIPFVPAMVVPYWSIDLFFIFAPFVCRTKEELQVFQRRIISAITVAGLCFYFFPLKLLFHAPKVQGVYGVLLDALNNFNNFYNLAPSLHIALRTILWSVYVPKTSGPLRIFLNIWFFLISASTLLVWQHHVIDVFTGQLLGLILVLCVAPKNLCDGEDVVIRKRAINSSLRVGFRYLSGCLITICLTAIFWPIGVLFLWLAAALGVISLGYLGLGPKIFSKENGKLSLAARSLLFPYLLGAIISYYYFTRRGIIIHEIAPNIFIGPKIPKKLAYRVADRKIKTVLDLTAEYSETLEVDDYLYKNIGVLDLCTPHPKQLEEAVNFISESSTKGGVYVHCSLGLGRSAAVAAAYLLSIGAVSNMPQAISRLHTLDSRLVFKRSTIKVLEQYASLISAK